MLRPWAVSLSLTVGVSLVRVLCTVLPDPLPSGLLALVSHVHRVVEALVEASVVTHTVVVVVVTIGLRLRRIASVGRLGRLSIKP